MSRPLLIQPGGGQRQQRPSSPEQAVDEILLRDGVPEDTASEETNGVFEQAIDDGAVSPESRQSLKRHVVIKQAKSETTEKQNKIVPLHQEQGKTLTEKYPSQGHLERAKFLGELDSQERAKEDRIRQKNQEAYERSRAVQQARTRETEPKGTDVRASSSSALGREQEQRLRKEQERQRLEQDRRRALEHRQGRVGDKPREDRNKREDRRLNDKPERPRLRNERDRGHGSDPRESLALQHRLDRHRQAKKLQEKLDEEKNFLQRMAEQGRNLFNRLLRRREDEKARIERETREQRLKLERDYRKAQEEARKKHQAEQTRLAKERTVRQVAQNGQRGTPRSSLEAIARKLRLDKLLRDQQAWLEKRYRDLRAALEKQRRDRLNRLEQGNRTLLNRERVRVQERERRLRLDRQRVERQRVERQRTDQRRRENDRRVRQESQTRERQQRERSLRETRERDYRNRERQERERQDRYRQDRYRQEQRRQEDRRRYEQDRSRSDDRRRR